MAICFFILVAFPGYLGVWTFGIDWIYITENRHKKVRSDQGCSTASFLSRIQIIHARRIFKICVFFRISSSKKIMPQKSISKMFNCKLLPPSSDQQLLQKDRPYPFVFLGGGCLRGTSVPKPKCGALRCSTPGLCHGIYIYIRIDI